MIFKDFLKRNEGKDIYIRIEYESGEQTENVIKDYEIKELEDDKCVIFGNNAIPSIIVQLNGEATKNQKLLLLESIEVINSNSHYYIYSMDNIDVQAENKWRKSIHKTKSTQLIGKLA